MFLQSDACYELLDDQKIVSAVPTGQFQELPFFPGFRYVAYRPAESHKVHIHLLSPATNKPILKCQESIVTYYEAMPESLVYLTHLFHVADIKVLVFKNMQW